MTPDTANRDWLEYTHEVVEQLTFGGKYEEADKIIRSVAHAGFLHEANIMRDTLMKMPV